MNTHRRVASPTTNILPGLVSALLFALLPLARGQAADAESGRFFREYWYERGLTNGNPKYERRFRVNAPETVLHPSFGQRIEARENGMMLIQAEENLSRLTGAELYLELWGGHPGTARKRVTINGRSQYELPDAGTAATNCTHGYPTIPLQITDLVNGYDALQFACDKGSTFWGHFIVDNASLRVTLTNQHPDLVKAGLGGFTAKVEAQPAGENIQLELTVPSAFASLVAEADFQGFFTGYDENGDGLATDWHGFTKDRKPEAWLGRSTAAPFKAVWDTSLLPAQTNMAVRAWVRFREFTNLVFVTPALSGLRTPDRRGSRVQLVPSDDLPRPFWSRAGNKKRCMINLPTAPARLERAEIHVVLWDGGAGTVTEHFTLNGHSIPLASGKSRHDVIYRRLPLDPKLLRAGTNVLELLSDTEHHGIEVLLPGPALAVRYGE
ncbi:MAG: hypothetical protein HZA90_00185 [Verrucomicrobia bacterium]|nr:hypothetical protein [Verrucomicrobiota bacterium]